MYVRHDLMCRTFTDRWRQFGAANFWRQNYVTCQLLLHFESCRRYRAKVTLVEKCHYSGGGQPVPYRPAVSGCYEN